jgi:hypothetical protein
MLVWTVVGAGGQLVANQIASSRAKNAGKPDEPGSAWGYFMTKLSDEDYINKMKEQILVVDADIALIDERIAMLRAGSPKAAPKGTKSP